MPPRWCRFILRTCEQFPLYAFSFLDFTLLASIVYKDMLLMIMTWMMAMNGEDFVIRVKKRYEKKHWIYDIFIWCGANEVAVKPPPRNIHRCNLPMIETIPIVYMKTIVRFGHTQRKLLPFYADGSNVYVWVCIFLSVQAPWTLFKLGKIKRYKNK